MVLTINGQCYTVDPEQAQRFVDDHVLANKLIVCGYIVNGMTYRFEVLDKMQSAETVEVLTQTAPEYMQSVYAELKAFNANVDEKLRGIINKLYARPDEQDITKVGRVLEFTTRIVNLHYQVHSLLGIVPDDASKTLRIDTLVNNELMTALQDEDLVTVADVISFELLPLVSDLVEDMKTKIAGSISPLADGEHD